MKNLRQIGSQKEDLAACYLVEQGYNILERNLYSRDAEADIIAMDGEILCFVEVKFRADDSYGLAEEAITPNKIRHMIKFARFYLMKNPQFNVFEIRFDVVAINGNDINLIKGAFDAY
ncbi:MAG: YraN family protein [Lachnospiraceae bacterium]|nr:YraN family protein [Lachnospiraceae bacterium]